MSIRKVDSYKNSSEYVHKTIDINRKIPFLYNIEDLENHQSLFTKREYLSIYQTFFENEIWENATREEQKVLAPVVYFYYDSNNCPALVFPRFEPLATERETFRFDNDEAISELYQRLSIKGMTDEEIGIFIEGAINFCNNNDVNEEDVLFNLNNIGWNPVFGVRIIDFGLSNEMTEKFYSMKPNI